MLISILRDVFRKQRDGSPSPSAASLARPHSNVPRVLNVGGASKEIPIPSYFQGWEHLLLDIDPRGGPDIVCDARYLETLAGEQFDAVYCSHNLEHYYRHDAYKVLRGFLHVLKADGFAEIKVPDVESVMRHAIERGMDIEDVLYVSAAGPIAVRDVIYGWGEEVERSGNDFYAHKNGFTPTSLMAALQKTGFGTVLAFASPEVFEVRAVAFKTVPTPEQRTLLGLHT